MSDFTDFPEPIEPSSTDSGPYKDIWEDNEQNPDAVLPPVESDLLEHETRKIGQPEELDEFWHYQGLTNDCGLYAQGGVLEADGQTFDLERYKQQGQDGGWYNPDDGTYVDSFGELWKENDMPANRYDNATIQDMAGELDQGHGVVVAVDVEPLWGTPGGHALWVTGMEVGDNGVPTNIICNDSGRDDGSSFQYPYESFKEAWGIQNNLMVATQNPISALN